MFRDANKMFSEKTEDKAKVEVICSECGIHDIIELDLKTQTVINSDWTCISFMVANIFKGELCHITLCKDCKLPTTEENLDRFINNDNAYMMVWQ